MNRGRAAGRRQGRLQTAPRRLPAGLRSPKPGRAEPRAEELSGPGEEPPLGSEALRVLTPAMAEGTTDVADVTLATHEAVCARLRAPGSALNFLGGLRDGGSGSSGRRAAASPLPSRVVPWAPLHDAQQTLARSAGAVPLSSPQPASPQPASGSSCGQEGQAPYVFAEGPRKAS